MVADHMSTGSSSATNVDFVIVLVSKSSQDGHPHCMRTRSVQTANIVMCMR